MQTAIERLYEFEILSVTIELILTGTFQQLMRSITVLGHVRNLLMEFDSKNDTVHLFMSMTVSGYFRYLISKSGNGTKRIYRNFIRSVKKNTKIEISDETTIKQFLNSMYSFQIQSWVPSIPIDKFEKEIRRSYEDLYCFFITYFKEALQYISSSFSDK